MEENKGWDIKIKLLVSLLFFLLLAVITIHRFKLDYGNMNAIQEHVQGDAIVFSKESGLYHNTLHITLEKEISFSKNAKIYYTLDGEDPTVDSEVYQQEIILEKENDTILYPIKAVVYDQGEYSKIYEKDYIIDSSNDLTLPVVSVTLPQEDLNSEEKGIFSQGNVYKDGEEWTKQAHVAIFDEDGKVLVQQGVGMSVSGGTSVEFAIKSFNLKADLYYDENHDKIHLDWFDNHQDESLFSFVCDYNSIKLRGGSQDINYGNIRSSLVSRLASESNFGGCSYTKRCIVYINGNLYGIFDMQQKNTNSFIKKKFGLEGESVTEVVKGDEYQVLDTTKMRNYFLVDLNDPKNREKLEKYIDMDNMLFYYALNILNDNKDWPGNNYAMWRYTGESYEGDQYNDGRYRFTMFDTDLVFYTYGMHQFFGNDEYQNIDIFSKLMSQYNLNIDGNRTYRSIFYNIMNSEYYRNRFITIVCDLLNTTYQKDNILKIVDEEYALIQQPMKNTQISDYDLCDQGIEQLKNAINLREDSLRNYFTKFFGVYNTYELTLKNAPGLNITWNQMDIQGNQTYTCNYYQNIEFTMKATPYPGYKFKYWSVNGEKVEGNELTITSEMQWNGHVDIEAISEPIQDGVLIISELSAKDDSDWFKITNVGTKPVDLKNYYLTDQLEILDYYQLPDLVLSHNESIIINGKKNYYAIGNYISNISLNMSEKLYITDGRHVIDFMNIPNMTKYETYGRDENSNTYKYFNNSYQQRKVSDY